MAGKPSNWPVDIPYIDTDVVWDGVSTLRQLNATELRQQDKVKVIHENGKPIVVVIPWDMFMRMQSLISDDNGNQ